VHDIQGLFVHIHWAMRYGISPDETQKEHVQSRHVVNIIRTILEIDPSPQSVARPLAKRFFGNCRDFSVLMAAVLRQKGVSARARCGFGKYFVGGHFIDHWVCEYWDGTRWVMVDAQLDDLQKSQMGVEFDSLDMPPGHFVTGAEAWSLARNGDEDPGKFGIFDMSGLWFIRANYVRDVASLNKVEMLPWDVWGLCGKPEADLTAEDFCVLDRLVPICMGDDSLIQEAYEREDFRVPQTLLEVVRDD
jgi:hypothetical protein